jgi:hypothetical protein
MIVRERPESFVLIQQNDHALAAGEFARHWVDAPRPFESAIHAIASHDVAWKIPDSSVRWNEDADRPHSFVDYPSEEKVRAYARGLDGLESSAPYAACLGSMHYERLLREFGSSAVETRFVEVEAGRQERLRRDMNAEEVENLERNLDLLRLCDGLSLFVCLNEPGSSDYPPPYPGGFRFDGETYQPVWEESNILRLRPNPFTEAFDVSIPYQEIDRDRQPVGEGRIELQVTL